LVEFIAADHCNIDVAGDGNALANRRSYTLDATSDRNILDFAGASTYALAGTDAGAGNLIRAT
jgi:hypothetical protein